MGGAAHKQKWTERKAAAWKRNSALGSAMIQQRSIAFARTLEDFVRPLKQEGLSLARIADRLNEAGYRTPHGTSWTKKQVQRVLQALGLTTKAPIVPTPIDVVQQAAKLFGLGFSLNQVAKTMNKENVACDDGRPWTHQKVARLLRRNGVDVERPFRLTAEQMAQVEASRQALMERTTP